MSISEGDLRRSLEQGLRRHAVPGASVAVFHDGKLLTAAAGLANVPAGVELTPDTVMHIGSVTKVLNATLVMQLVDEGLVDLDAPVTQYLPDVKLKDPAVLARITVRMLLNHTSGIDGEILPEQGHDEETIAKGIERFAGLGQIHAPGAEISYCNAATVIAGYLAQKLTGRSWYRLIRERIFEPLGLAHSVTLPEEALLHRASVGHFLDPASRQLVRTSFAFLPLSFAPCGTTLMMSARDLVTFARAHVGLGMGVNGARILSEASTRQMQQVTVDGRGKHYTLVDGIGLGWMVLENGVIHHSGGGPGIGAVLYVHPRSGFAAAILTNAAHASPLINELIAPWLEEVAGIKPLGVVDTLRPLRTAIDPDRYVGVYEAVLNRYEVSRTPNGLALSQQAKWSFYDNVTTAPTTPAPLTPLSEDTFLLQRDSAGPTQDATLVFTFRNALADGRMNHLGNGLRLYRRVS